MDEVCGTPKASHRKSFNFLNFVLHAFNDGS